MDYSVRQDRTPIVRTGSLVRPQSVTFYERLALEQQIAAQNRAIEVIMESLENRTDSRLFRSEEAATTFYLSSERAAAKGLQEQAQIDAAKAKAQRSFFRSSVPEGMDARSLGEDPIDFYKRMKKKSDAKELAKAEIGMRKLKIPKRGFRPGAETEVTSQSLVPAPERVPSGSPTTLTFAPRRSKGGGNTTVKPVIDGSVGSNHGYYIPPPPAALTSRGFEVGTMKPLMFTFPPVSSFVSGASGPSAFVKVSQPSRKKIAGPETQGPATDFGESAERLGTTLVNENPFEKSTNGLKYNLEEDLEYNSYLESLELSETPNGLFSETFFPSGSEEEANGDF